MCRRRLDGARHARIIDDLARALVLAQPLERGMAQDRVSGPAGEFDLGDEGRADPMDTLARRLLGQGDGRGLDDQSVELFAQIGETLGAKAGADASRIAQCSRRVVVTGEKGAKTFALAFGVGKADDNDLLAIAAFDLEPSAAASLAVGRVAALGDDAFEAEAARLAKNGRTLARLVVAVAQYPLSVRRDDVGECRLAVFERCTGQVPAVAVKKVEGEEIQDSSLAAGDRVLQAGKIRCP